MLQNYTSLTSWPSNSPTTAKSLTTRKWNAAAAMKKVIHGLGKAPCTSSTFPRRFRSLSSTYRQIRIAVARKAKPKAMVVARQQARSRPLANWPSTKYIKAHCNYGDRHAGSVLRRGQGQGIRPQPLSPKPAPGTQPQFEGAATSARPSRGDEFQILLVANKFQTGFDQPLLVRHVRR